MTYSVLKVPLNPNQPTNLIHVVINWGREVLALVITSWFLSVELLFWFMENAILY